MEADVENFPGMYLLKGTFSSTASSSAVSGYSIYAAFPPYPLIEMVGGFNQLNLVPTKRANYITSVRDNKLCLKAL